MIISVASGKGGTGKTTIAVNLALSLGKVQFLDCDVEAPNAALFLKPLIKEKHIVNLPLPQINEDKCDYCGKCAEVCEWNALAVLKDKVLLFPELCHSCGACWTLCPQKAIDHVDRELGIVEKGETGEIQFIHGRLTVGEAVVPPLIKAVKREIEKDGLVIIDSAPGTACPAVEAVKGASFCLLVTEPTPFGLNDLKLAVEMVRGFDIPLGVVINRADVGDKEVEKYCRKEKIPVLMKIPLDRELAVLYSDGENIVNHRPEWKERFIDLFDKIKELVKK